MQSRMDKYNTEETPIKSRIQKNKGLYEVVKKSDITDFNVNSNVSIIDTNADNIDVTELSHILDKKYSDTASKRISIEVPEGRLFEYEEPLNDTKEYDINSILEKAKVGKTVDYNKERLKQARVAQYEILSNLDLELKRAEENRISSKKKEEEDNLMNLINTITQLELKNKEEEKAKETSQALELFTDLSDEGGEVDEDDRTLPQSEIPENYTKEMTKHETGAFEIGEPVEKTQTNILPDAKEVESGGKITRDTHIEETLSKLDIKIDSYDDFSDISKRDTGAFVIKLIIFVIIIALVIGAAVILNDVLDLGLF